MQTTGNRFSIKPSQYLPKVESKVSSVDILEKISCQHKLTQLHQSQFAPDEIFSLLYFALSIFALQCCCLQSPVVKSSRNHLIEDFVYLQLNAKCLRKSERTAHYYRSFVLLSASAINFNTQFSPVQANNKKTESKPFSFLCCIGNIPKTKPLHLVVVTI